MQRYNVPIAFSLPTPFHRPNQRPRHRHDGGATSPSRRVPQGCQPPSGKAPSQPPNIPPSSPSPSPPPGDNAPVNSARRRILTAALASLLPLALPNSSPPPAKAIPPNTATALRLSDDEWRHRLTRSQFRVLRQAGTEMPFSSALNAEKRTGLFVCVGCAQPVFSSRDKFESGTGWPSFSDVVPGAITLHRKPKDVFLLRVEVRCSRCDGHLGHVFDDGPKPTRKRYCMNGVALRFVPGKF